MSRNPSCSKTSHVLLHASKPCWYQYSAGSQPAGSNLAIKNELLLFNAQKPHNFMKLLDTQNGDRRPRFEVKKMVISHINTRIANCRLGAVNAHLLKICVPNVCFPQYCSVQA